MRINKDGMRVNQKWCEELPQKKLIWEERRQQRANTICSTEQVSKQAI